MDEYFRLACEATLAGMDAGTGGPFGATLVDPDGKVVVAVGNTVGRDLDPSGHAELVAVREACRTLGTLDLSGHTMYATCEPCPMCVAVMMLTGITTCHYASTDADATEGGFPVDHIRDFLAGTRPDAFTLVHEADGREDCAGIWTSWHEKND